MSSSQVAELSAEHEAFAQAVADGESATAAYRSLLARPGTLTTSCMVEGCKLLKNPNVAQRVAHLRKEFREVLENTLGVKQETLARFFVSVIETPVGEVDESHPLCQEMKRSRKVCGHGEDAQEWETELVKTPSKLDAADKLTKMAGWYAPEEVNLGPTDRLTSLMERMRDR